MILQTECCLVISEAPASGFQWNSADKFPGSASSFQEQAVVET